MKKAGVLVPKRRLVGGEQPLSGAKIALDHILFWVIVVTVLLVNVPV
jgi:hypothetical protein